MNEKMIQEFAHRYGARIDYQQGRGTVHTYAKAMDYYDDSKSIVDIEISRIGFEHLVQMDHEAEVDYRARNEEARIRKNYPAVADAYSKYKMLLELCK